MQLFPQESRSLYVSVYFDSSRLKRDVANDLWLHQVYCNDPNTCSVFSSLAKRYPRRIFAK